MIELTRERVELLKKLYNLRSEESVITNSIKNEISNLTTNKEITLKEMNEQEEIKHDLENDLDKFVRESGMFVETFKSFDNDSFAMLREIGIDIQVGTMLDKISLSAPEYEKEQKKLIKNSKNIIDDKKKTIEDLQNSIEYNASSLREAEENQKGLNDLLVNILEQGNIDSYNRAFIKGKLEKLNYFSDDEICTLEMLILFPEQGLSEFDKQYKEGKVDSISVEEPKINVIEEKETVEETKPVYEVKTDENIDYSIPTYEIEEPLFENNVMEIEKALIPSEEVIVEEEVKEFEPITIKDEPFVPVIDLNFEIPTFDEEFNFEDQTSKVEEPTPVVVEEQAQESLLKKLNLIEERFTKKEIDLINNTNEAIVISNSELLTKELELNPESEVIYNSYNNYMYLTDEELKNKVNILRSKGINDKIIRDEILSENIMCSQEQLSNRISLLEKNGESIKDNLSLLKNSLETFYSNLDKLNKVGIPVDDKEKVNYRYILTNKEVDEDLEVLKNYLIMLRKTNGKLALNVFNKEAKQLVLEIDKLIEANLEDLIDSNPEVLSQNVDTVIKRVEYCLQNNIEIKSNSDSYMKYIYDAQVFNELVNNKEESFANINLPSSEDTMTLLVDNIENKDLISILNDCYSKEEIATKIEIKNPEIENNFNNIMNSISDTLNGLSINQTERVLEIDGLKVSINKFKRNLYEIVKLLHEQNKDIESNKKEAILVAALYNLSAPKDKVENIITTCMNEEEIGGII